MLNPSLFLVRRLIVDHKKLYYSRGSKSMGFQNIVGPEKHQAVALRIQLGDRWTQMEERIEIHILMPNAAAMPRHRTNELGLGILKIWMPKSALLGFRTRLNPILEMNNKPEGPAEA